MTDIDTLKTLKMQLEVQEFLLEQEEKFVEKLRQDVALAKHKIVSAQLAAVGLDYRQLLLSTDEFRRIIHAQSPPLAFGYVRFIY